MISIEGDKAANYGNVVKLEGKNTPQVVCLESQADWKLPLRHNPRTRGEVDSFSHIIKNNDMKIMQLKNAFNAQKAQATVKNEEKSSSSHGLVVHGRNSNAAVADSLNSHEGESSPITNPVNAGHHPSTLRKDVRDEVLMHREDFETAQLSSTYRDNEILGFKN